MGQGKLFPCGERRRLWTAGPVLPGTDLPRHLRGGEGCRLDAHDRIGCAGPRVHAGAGPCTGAPLQGAREARHPKGQGHLEPRVDGIVPPRRRGTGRSQRRHFTEPEPAEVAGTATPDGHAAHARGAHRHRERDGFLRRQGTQRGAERGRCGAGLSDSPGTHRRGADRGADRPGG